MAESIFHNISGKTILPVGLQAHNSSTDTVLMEKTIEAIKAVHGNCLEAPVYWYLLEPEEDNYDTGHVKRLIDKSREAGLYLIILWFGTSKNGHPNYTPEYVKLHPEKYLMAHDCDGAPVEALSVHCTQTCERDKKAFCELIAFIRQYDSDTHTVLAVQVENEMGYGGIDRDYSKIAEETFHKEVPQELSEIKIKGSNIEGVTADDIQKMSSPWKKQFGQYAEEAFSAWYTARYINSIAEAGKQIYSIPMTVNVMVGENWIREAGLSYNSGAAVSRMLDVWKVAAPAIDVIGPDIYQENKREFAEICMSYDRVYDNPLYIPESPVSGVANAMNLIEAAGKYGATGVFCFGAEFMLNEKEEISGESCDIAISLQTIAAMSPLLISYRESGRIYAITEEEFETERLLEIPPYHVVAHFLNSHEMNLGCTPRREYAEHHDARGRALLVQTGENEFYLGGAGVCLDFIRIPEITNERRMSLMRSRAYSQLNFLSVEEGHFDSIKGETCEEQWTCDFRRNGDETNFSQYVMDGELIRIRLNPSMDKEANRE